MAPRSFPEEIDVFTVPHSRMKELVNIYTQKVQRLDFRDGREVILLLHDLGTTLSEFKSHESIENIFIMDQLKNRLKQRQIHNTAVCDCHNDNRLSDVLQLVQTGTKVREQGMGELLSFGQELQRSFEEFVENFLTHMEEEEQVFQPLLVEHFEYDELKVLKDIVLKEHEYIKDRQNQEKANEEEPETCDVVKELRDLDLDLCCLSEESLEQESDSLSLVSSTALKEDPCLNSTYADPALVSCKVFDAAHLPTEILLEVFRYLSPQDLGSCAQVCSSWNNAAYAPTLWKAVYPVQWARGIWGWRNVWLCNTLEEKALRKQSSGFHKWDEDKDVDEAEEEEEQDPLADKEHSMLEGLVNWVLPRVGHAVKTLVVDAGSGITSRLLHQALILCPNISILSAAHTQIDYYLFKGLPGCLQKLQHLNLQGCELIDDGALECLAQCAAPDHPYLSSEYTPDPDDVQYTCPNEARENTFNESWTLNHGEPIYQYCGYCSCWRANLAPQRPNNNTSYLDNFCQSRNNQKSSYRQPSMSNSTSHRKFSYEHHSNHSTQVVHSSSKTLSNYEALNPERDIEEICCRQGNSYSTGNNFQQSNSHRSLAFEDTNEYNPNMKGQKDQFEPYSYVSSSRFQLKDLSLSGCWRVTDEGLLALVDAGVVDRLYHLDVSGCFQLTGEGLKAFMYYSQGLKAENMFYCDNIIDGPYPTQANGCANLCNPIRVCCRNGR